VPRVVRHDYPLFGLRAERRVGTSGEFYAGWSQAYRPMLLKDLLPENALEVSDSSMRDARGWTVEAGVRGRRGPRIGYDIGAFWMRYDGRFGALLRDDGSGPYLFKTNLGSTRTLGVEISADALLRTTQAAAWRGFVSAAFFDAVYREGIVVSAGTNVSLEGNAVEGVPRAIVRTGITRDGSRSSMSLQLSHTARSFGDPLNTVTPNVTGARGRVPAYTLVDANGSIRLSPLVRVRFGLTNLLDAMYFTKRPAFYPGPGVWPSDGIGFQGGVEFGR
jgi:Fe(3+) dicitrate transport protein